MTDEPTVREHSDEGCMAIERERLAQIADLETSLRGCRTALGDSIVESDAEITRLRGVIAQLREDWRPKAQQEVAAMTAAREVARLWNVQRGLYQRPVETVRMADWIAAHDRLVKAISDG